MGMKYGQAMLLSVFIYDDEDLRRFQFVEILLKVGEILVYIDFVGWGFYGWH